MMTLSDILGEIYDTRRVPLAVAMRPAILKEAWDRCENFAVAYTMLRIATDMSASEIVRPVTAMLHQDLRKVWPCPSVEQLVAGVEREFGNSREEGV